MKRVSKDKIMSYFSRYKCKVIILNQNKFALGLLLIIKIIILSIINVHIFTKIYKNTIAILKFLFQI